jgi:predicted ArsR family transcriptional regulator
MSTHPGVTFSGPGEFVAEIARDHMRGLVEVGIVRVIKVGRPAMNRTMTRVGEEAAAIGDSRCVRLCCACGHLWSKTGDEQVQRRASDLVRELERASCSTLGSSSAPGSTTTERRSRVSGETRSTPSPARAGFTPFKTTPP